MNDPGLIQNTKGIQQLRGKHADQTHAQSSELVLLDQLVQVHREQLKDQTQVTPVNEGILQSQNMVPIVHIVTLVQKLEDRYLHHTLVKVGGFVFDHFDSHDRIRLQVLALDDLTKRSLTQDIQNQVSSLDQN